ncbi:MAG: hypothetical protein QW303_07150 [Nitrososphaerota archaeon]
MEPSINLFSEREFAHDGSRLPKKFRTKIFDLPVCVNYVTFDSKVFFSIESTIEHNNVFVDTNGDIQLHSLKDGKKIQEQLRLIIPTVFHELGLRFMARIPLSTGSCQYFKLKHTQGTVSIDCDELSAGNTNLIITDCGGLLDELQISLFQFTLQGLTHLVQRELTVIGTHCLNTVKPDTIRMFKGEIIVDVQSGSSVYKQIEHLALYCAELEKFMIEIHGINKN